MKKNILLVEDNTIIALTVKYELENYGYEVFTAHSGEYAVETIKNNADIDLILMDINLGYGMDGTEAAQSILEIRDIPIVFHSSHTDLEIIENTEKISSYGYVVKNTGITVLDTSIKMAFKLFKSKIKEKEKKIALRKSETLFRTAIESVPFDLFALDNNQIYTIQNSKSKNKWGNIIGKKPEDVAENEQTLALWKNNNDRVLSGETIRGVVTSSINGIEKKFFNIISPIIEDRYVTGILGLNISIEENDFTNI